MKEYRMSLKEALAYVKGRRSVVNPNDGFIAQLRDYEGILKARYVQHPLIVDTLDFRFMFVFTADIIPSGVEWHQAGHS